MISSISQRLPQKTCGLFDKGFAGGALDVTSLDLSTPALIPNTADSLESLGPSDIGPAINKGETVHDGKMASEIPHLMDTWDFLDPFADLGTDPLADESLDAFVNLDEFLMGDALFDENVEVKPVIDIPLADMRQENAEVKPVIDIPLTDVEHMPSSFDQIFGMPDMGVCIPQVSNANPRKRKAITKSAQARPIKTSLFEIPLSENVVTTTSPSADPQFDHDYTNKRQKVSASPGSWQKCGSKDNGMKHEKLIKCSFPEPECSTTSEEFDSGLDSVVDKQAIRRMKNNVASKRSREQRKQKFAEMDVEAERLIERNDELRKKIVELEKLAKEMKAKLVAKMAGK